MFNFQTSKWFCAASTSGELTDGLSGGWGRLLISQILDGGRVARSTTQRRWLPWVSDLRPSPYGGRDGAAWHFRQARRFPECLGVLFRGCVRIGPLTTAARRSFHTRVAAASGLPRSHVHAPCLCH